MITWNDFEKIDIRTGTIIGVEEFPQAIKPAYKLTIDFGEIGIKRSSAQITTLYTPQSLIGMTILGVVNFPPKKIANFWSECLVLGVHTNTGVVLLTTQADTENGLRIC